MEEQTEPPTSRERLIGATVDLLREKGPSSSGTAEILERADTPRGSFYFHFPQGKNQLVAAAVDRHAASTQAAMRSALADHDVPIGQRVTRMIEEVAEALVADDYTLGCAVASTALETASTSDALRETTQTAFAGWADMLADLLSGEQIDPARARELADAIVAGLEGATMLARVSRDASALHHTARVLGGAVAAAAAA